MDDAILKYYRPLLRNGFRNAGSYEDPSIYLNSVSSRKRVCIGAGGYMRVYIKVKDGVIEDVKYLCSCDPTANVAVEILCDLIRGKTLEEAANLTVDMFSAAIDGPSEDLRKSATGLIDLLNEGIRKYREENNV